MRLRNFINTVNKKENQFVIAFLFFMIRGTGEKGKWWHFGFYQDWRNHELILKDLRTPHFPPEIILIKITRTEEATVRRYSSKYVFLKFRNILRETPVLESLFNKVAILGPVTLSKRDYNTDVFRWILLLRTTFFIEYLWWLFLE